ncbi:DUF2147 domain-containing protein [Novosphingobium sp. NDB2Meth1]|uniref:DUF2147 domain-containing protein n=1 Tax=Novosphingobium sp. NDB2Meth1 TaxID=1892847 RepID=UPI000930646E|nr:DUF2147 domain-containing protein [Novosphingobium sp. NDB2Meth1]
MRVRKGLLVGALVMAASAGAAEQASPYGTWRTPERGGLIEVSQCDGGLCGKILGGTGSSPEDRFDRNNKNPALRSRQLIGLYVFRGLKPAGGSWKGSIYNPSDGGTYSATVTLKSASEMTVKGCVVWPLCKTQVWAKVK